MNAVPFPALHHWLEKRYGPSVRFLESQLRNVDPVVMNSVDFEIRRQTSAINLIASESMPSQSVMAASASLGYVQTVEGRSGRRWYPYVDGIDALESVAEARARTLFQFPEANVQPHSATQANQAVYLTVLNPGDTILSPAFTSGGHLSHGVRSSLAGRLYKIETYGPRSFGEQINMEDLEARIRKTNPHLIIAGCSAYPRQVPFESICRLGKQYGAHVLADISHTAGFVAAKLHSAVDAADFCTMSLHKTMCGPRGGIVLTQIKYRERLDKAVFPGLQGAILPNLVAAKAVCLGEASQNSFKGLQAEILTNARAMAQAFLEEGIDLYTGGTDTQLLVIRRGPSIDASLDVERLLQIGILTNANYVHGDTLGTTKMSGIRIGTTWITQLGFKAQHAAALAHAISEALKAKALQCVDLRRRLEKLIDEVVSASDADAGNPVNSELTTA